MRFLLTYICLCGLTLVASAKDHGFITYQGKTIKITGYRLRTSQGKRWVIADGKSDGRLFSLTIILQPDMQQRSRIQMDATRSVTLTSSKEDYSDAHNNCFDGGRNVQVTPVGSGLVISARDLPAGNCLGKSGVGDRISFELKP